MRDRRFIAIHRGGVLSNEHHKLLILWACECSENVLRLLGEEPDNRLISALIIARRWEKGSATTGEAIKISRIVHSVARGFRNPVEIAVARAIGHAVATAHMADHSLGSALYALKAVSHAGGSVAGERNWQNEILPDDIRELVLSSRGIKEKASGLLNKQKSN